MQMWKPKSRHEHRPRKPAISLSRIASETSCWNKASFSRTRRTEFDGKENKAAHEGRARGRPQEDRPPYSRDHADLHRGQLLLRKHRAARSRLWPGGAGI